MRMLIRALSAFVLLSVLIVHSVHACLWDRDTLAMEAEHFPGVTEVLTGRFDRYPGLYYEKRLVRVTEEIASAPENLELYDDAGVACDRLGRHDEAIGWMEKKRVVLDALAEPDAEHEYRYLANLGTFYIHRWLGGGADRAGMRDAEAARDLIARAIDLNPDAHFGRERYQLLAIEWILKADEPQTGSIVFGVNPRFDGSDDWHFANYEDGLLTQLGYRDPVAGLSGLIVLGNAWESIDIFRALQVAFVDEGHTRLAYVCMLRIRELLDDGHRSLHPAFPYDLYSEESIASTGVVHSRAALDDYFLSARAEAARWARDRDAYLMGMLRAG